MYPLLLLAASIGNAEVISTLVSNKTFNINIVEPSTEVNAFWVAAFYGRGECMQLLANAGSNMEMVQNETKSNALHVAI